MPRYFFDLDDGTGVRDEEGIEVETPAEIEATAIRALLDIARHEGPSVFGKPLTITVRDEGGKEVHRATMTVEFAWKTDQLD